MTCYFPMQGYRSRDLTKNGKRKIVFSPNEAIDTSSLFRVVVPCGQCIGCRLERSRQWAVRCVHEASRYRDNCFITLTYSDDYLPTNRSLDITHYQKFMKRLRKRFNGTSVVFDGDGLSATPIRFFHCGEYGERFGRPHYHACIFNFDFPDKYLWKVVNGSNLFRSPILEELWPFGLSSVGSVTFESAAYVARYIMKKVNGDASLTRYAIVDYETGEVLGDIQPEYTTMSRKPGIGKDWFNEYMDDVYPRDEVVLRGKKMRPPKFYDSLYELHDPLDYERLKVRRKHAAKLHADNNTYERLDVRRRVKEAQVSLLVRNVDKEI